jgi:hypothetical protein
MAEKFIQLVSGELTENEGLQSSAGASDAGKIPALDGTGRFSETMMPVGIGVESKSMVASENLSASDLVNIWNDSGTQKARKADASNNRRAHGYVLEAVTSGQSATVRFEQSITGLSGLTPGATQFLGVSGAMTATPPSTATHISQQIGVAVTADEVSFEPQQPITLA